MPEQSHRSIGEVLSLLQDEFPDVTISKIRFLESQGLLEPERTPSGYRKFYDVDLVRLRWILTQQRDNFLPLKVIKDRLDAGPLPEELDPPGAPGDAGEGAAGSEALPAPVEDGATVNGASSRGAPPPGAPGGSGGERGEGRGARRSSRHGARPAGGRAGTGTVPAGAQGPDEAGEGGDAEARGPSGGAPPSERAEEGAAAHAGGTAAPGEAGAGGATPSEAATPEGEGPEEQAVAACELSLEELAEAADVEVSLVRELERFGLVTRRQAGADVVYDEDALAAARLAARFRHHGFEARHLRLYRMAVDRELGLFEQVVAPLLRQRGRGEGSRAHTTLVELGELGDEMRRVLLRRAMRELLGGG